MFGLFKKKSYPLIKADMIEPIDAPISTSEAKRIYKMYMKQINFYDKDELSELVSYVGDEIKSEQESYRDDIAAYKESIKECKADLKRFEAKLKSANSEEEKTDISDEIQCVKETIEDETEQLEETKAELEEFKKDKRRFIVDYINQEISNGR